MTEPTAPLHRLADQVAAARHGRTTVVELIDAALERVDATRDIHAWVTMSEHALSDAAERDERAERGALHGVALGVKDIIDVAGLPTRCGSAVTPPEPVGTSAACVRRLEQLGAVVLGKTVTTEFAYFAPGPTRNPHNLEHTPGGSSSGSAAAVAAGVVPLALGSQTAGSLTRPAAYCGVAGLVLAHGSVDMAGIAGLSPSLDSLGLLTPGVQDLAYAYQAFTGDHLDEAARPSVLVWRGTELADIDPQMVTALECAAGLLAEAGLEVRELDWSDHVETLAADHVTIMAYEAVREAPDLYEQHRAELSAPLVELLASGLAISDEDYRAAIVRRDRSREDLQDVLGAGAVVLGPAAPGPAPRGLGATGSPILSRPWQALGLVALTVPGARTSTGLPLGLQVIGLPGHESGVFAAARSLESRLAGDR
ncbi:Asp-tRNAAsn/Glu-tRNAGln amidotransferase A subunit [Raineyella antarctica]|uniref:Asp-tRNAAsn/Glu-tRNAGln amidotransferase A subunit n=1 Tax=Raineyella antarctica TaxID=1577474 RepID=A0A1G6GJ67_9ACTN|nr:amidase [Raineyella antarctica]SDB81984.1 Asp-tRNAAsn/Glu-tRNAGln amidotransferase A subunit [Raineyella antarctica]